MTPCQIALNGSGSIQGVFWSTMSTADKQVERQMGGGGMLMVGTICLHAAQS